MVISRLERIGNIYTRVIGLMKSNALRWEDRPLWFDLYEKFPPKDEPRFDRPAPNLPLKKIFYEEDKIRALFHKNNKQLGAVNLNDTKYKTTTQNFIDLYKKLDSQYKGAASEEQIYQEALEMFRRERQNRAESGETLSTAFQQASDSKQKVNVNVDVKDIFKD